MKTEKMKLTEPKISKLYGYRKPDADKLFETTTSGDITTTCTSIVSTTHLNKV